MGVGNGDNLEHIRREFNEHQEVRKSFESNDSRLIEVGRLTDGIALNGCDCRIESGRESR